MLCGGKEQINVQQPATTTSCTVSAACNTTPGITTRMNPSTVGKGGVGRGGKRSSKGERERERQKMERESIEGDCPT